MSRPRTESGDSDTHNHSVVADALTRQEPDEEEEEEEEDDGDGKEDDDNDDGYSE